MKWRTGVQSPFDAMHWIWKRKGLWSKTNHVFTWCHIYVSSVKPVGFNDTSSYSPSSCSLSARARPVITKAMQLNGGHKDPYLTHQTLVVLVYGNGKLSFAYYKHSIKPGAVSGSHSVKSTFSCWNDFLGSHCSVTEKWYSMSKHFTWRPFSWIWIWVWMLWLFRYDVRFM